jgi:hypothetical protein
MTVPAGLAGKTPRSSGWLVGSKTRRNLIHRIAIFRLAAPGVDSPVHILGSANFLWRDSKFASFPSSSESGTNSYRPVMSLPREFHRRPPIRCSKRSRDFPDRASLQRSRCRQGGAERCRLAGATDRRSLPPRMRPPRERPPPVCPSGPTRVGLGQSAAPTAHHLFPV